MRRRTGAGLVAVLLALCLVGVLVGPTLELATGSRRRTDQEGLRLRLTGLLQRVLLEALARPWDEALAAEATAPAPAGPALAGVLDLASASEVSEVTPGLLEVRAWVTWTGRDGRPRRLEVRRLRALPTLSLQDRGPRQETE